MTAQRNYAPLDAGELVDPDFLGTGAGGGKFLKDDQTWDTPAGSGSVATDAIWDAAGDLAVGSGANTAAKLTKGSDGQVLTVDPTTHLLVWATPAAAGAPTTADYLVGTAQGGLSAEIVVGATPGGELGGTWASPTVDATHSGSAHHAESHASRHAAAGADAVKLDDLAAPDDNTDLNVSSSAHGLMSKLPGGGTNFFREDGTWAAPSGSGAPASVDYLVGTADAGLSGEIVVGTTPGGELGGTWASPTVDATHSGSAHHTQSHDHSSAGDGTTLTPAHLNVPQETPGTTEGRIGWDATAHGLLGYDSQRGRGLSEVGWNVYAYPINFSALAALATASTIAANGGSVAIPMAVIGHMLLDSVTVRNLNVATARTWGWDLYVERLNNGNAGENTLDRVASSSADDTFTPGAASTRSVTASGGPIYLPPGLYWLVVQCRHATNSFDIATTAGGHAFGPGGPVQTKTTTNPNGATLDFVAASWTQNRAVYAAWLRGRVFGQATPY